MSLGRAGWHKASQGRYIHDVRVRIRSWGWTITSSRIRLVAMARVGVSSRAVAEFAEMTAKAPSNYCRAEVKTAPKGRVTPKILSKLHGLCSVRKHVLDSKKLKIYPLKEI